MTYPDTLVDESVGLIDEEARDPVKCFCEALCELIRTKIAADTDAQGEGLASDTLIGDLLCLDRHRKATMAADIHSLDIQLIRTHSSDHRGRKAMRELAEKRLE
jgi:hypothetical protein